MALIKKIIPLKEFTVTFFIEAQSAIKTLNFLPARNC